MATMAPSAKACRVLDLSTYTHNTPRPPVRAERAISCVLRGSVWLADEKVRLAGGDKRGLITLLFVARPPQNLSEFSFEAFTSTVDYQYNYVFHDIAHSGWRGRGTRAKELVASDASGKLFGKDVYPASFGDRSTGR